jgi:peptide-methionine (S)-S-oxide reductase
VFQPLVGVREVRQGFIRSDAPDDTWSEAVEVTFDPADICLMDLLAVHLTTHASQSDHKMRGKYRSAVYVSDEAQQAECQDLIEQLGAEADTPFITRALMRRGFKPSDSRFHDYYRSNPEKPFCQNYIEPKLAKLRANYNSLLKRKDSAI